MAALNILLINPMWRGHGNRKKIKVSENLVHPLSLGIIAGIIRKHDPGHRVAIIDQTNTPVPFSAQVDLVGITVNTYTASIAYEIADRFRGRGVPVIFGGVHATLMPDECLQHADAVIQGEAEESLPKFLDDFIQKRTSRVYQAGTLTNTEKIPVPDRSLFSLKGANAAFVQATRGCNNICSFCYLRDVPWGNFRPRSVESVLEEVQGIDQDIILFVDDNMFVDRDYCVKLFRALRRCGKHWWAQAPTTLAYDKELLELVADSGCFSLSYGFQTISQASLEKDQIIQNRIENYRNIVRTTQQVGILVDGTFIFGFDGDTQNIFPNTVKMVKYMDLDTYTFYMLTVYPGTPYYSRFRSDGRVISADYGKFDWDHVIIKPKNMSPETLDAGVKWAYEQLDKYYRRHFLRKVIRNAGFAFRSWNLAKFLLSSGVPRRYYNDY